MVTASTTAIQKANWNNPLMLTSRFSHPALASTGTFGFSECLVAMLMPQDTFKSRIVQRQQRHFLQLPHERADPHAANSDESKNVLQMDLGTRLFKGWNDQPIDVHQGYDQHPRGQDRKFLQPALDLPLQQDEERHEEMEHQQRGRDRAPSAERARHIPRNFLLQ